MPPYTPYVSKDFVIEGSFLRLDDKEKAWNAIDGRMRTAIRKAQQSGATIRKVENTRENVERFASFCLNPDDIPQELTERYHLYFGELKGTVIAAILVVEVGNKLFMLCHASVPEAKRINLPSLLVWRIVEDFTGSRFRVFDIGTSYRPSLQTFFSGWKSESYPMIMNAPVLHPSLLFTPFDTAAMAAKEPEHSLAIARRFIDEASRGKPWTFFPRAMYAIYTLIRDLTNSGVITRDGNVWVTTTTDTHFVSSCVSSAIEQSTTLSRSLTEKTCAILAIHEFGFPHPKLSALRAMADERGIPLIEDCAYAWGTTAGGVGTTGDYVIHSLTKTFPVQFGGILIGKHYAHDELWKSFGCSDVGKEVYTLTKLGAWANDASRITERRCSNYAWYDRLFGSERTYFPLEEGIMPGAYVLRCTNESTMQQQSSFVRTFGIECGNYWKNSAIILPVHQRLEPAHLEYIAGSVLATEREWCGIPHPPHGVHRP